MNEWWKASVEGEQRGRHDDQRCRCCKSRMQASDHCPDCGCEEFEERKDCPMRVGGQ